MKASETIPDVGLEANRQASDELWGRKLGRPDQSVHVRIERQTSVAKIDENKLSGVGA